MNARQKEVLLSQLNDEKAVLKALEKNYEDALSEIYGKIAQLMGRNDADMQHVIYQVQYQQALKTQVQAILETLQTNEFETLSEYLSKSYEAGFLGTMYDMHGQGIPLIFPIDQAQVMDAIMTETNLSEKLYTKLGKDIKDLQKKVASEISRGMSTGMMYGDMARNIAGWAKIPQNNAMRIARTESHRIQCKAAYDAQHKAKSKGADVVKQWDATLDGKTRDSHREIDGEIREIDEPFSNRLQYPGDPSGAAGEVINCRCALLQRARWNLGEDDLKRMKERAEYFELDKTKNFEEFKKKYLKATEQVDDREFKVLTLDDFKKMKHSISAEERKIVYGKGHFSGYINSSNARKMNEVMRAGVELSDEYQKIADTLQKIIDKNSINDDIMVTRYVKGDALESLIGVKLPVYSMRMDKDVFWNSIDAIPSQLKKGTIYPEKGFLSTSGVPDENVMTDKLIKMNIKAPKGTNCYVTTNYKESEIIFGQNTKLKITNCSIENSRQAGWKIVLDCEIV